jgi:hypothetical protein
MLELRRIIQMKSMDGPSKAGVEAAARTRGRARETPVPPAMVRMLALWAVVDEEESFTVGPRENYWRCERIPHVFMTRMKSIVQSKGLQPASFSFSASDDVHMMWI